jgi:hypothetical protein
MSAMTGSKQPADIYARLLEALATTPGQVKAWAAGAIAAAVLAAALGIVAYSGLRNAVQTVGKDTVPSIVAAQRVRATLADANANAINAFLVGEKGVGPFRKKFREEMATVEDSLLTAAQNITYGQEERTPILAMLANLGEYERLLGVAQTQGPQESGRTLGEAVKLVHDVILPAGLVLDQANFGHLTETYQAHCHMAALQRVLFMAGVLLLVAVLAGLQVLLCRRTGRFFSLPLVAATLVAAGYLAYGLTTLDAAEASLHRAKQDAFDSVHALSKARAVAYDANGDESLYLVVQGDGHAQSLATEEFQAKAAQLVPRDVDLGLAATGRGPRFGGFLGDELANITFTGEGEAALGTLRAWGDYVAIDGRIRDLERNGDHAGAVALDVGTREGQSNWAFDRFDKALGDTLAINQREFEAATARAFAALRPFLLVTALAAILVAVGVLAGVKPRLDEYRF